MSFSIEVISEKNKNWTLEHKSPEVSNVHALVFWELLLGMVIICRVFKQSGEQIK